MSLCVSVENETKKEGVLTRAKLAPLGSIANSFARKPVAYVFVTREVPCLMASLGCAEDLVLLYVGKDWRVNKISKLVRYVGLSGGRATWIVEIPQKEYLNNVSVGDKLSFSLIKDGPW